MSSIVRFTTVSGSVYEIDYEAHTQPSRADDIVLTACRCAGCNASAAPDPASEGLCEHCAGAEAAHYDGGASSEDIRGVELCAYHEESWA
jgi:hypothetical protein